MTNCNTQQTGTYCDAATANSFDNEDVWNELSSFKPQEVLDMIHGWLGDPFYYVFIGVVIGFGIGIALLILQFQVKRIRSR